MPLTLTVTDAGRAALANAELTGTAPVLMNAVGVSATDHAVDASTTALTGEIKRLATMGGTVTGETSIHVLVRDITTDDYTVRAFALYLDDEAETLFAAYSQAGPIIIKTAEVTLAMALDIAFADISADTLTFGDATFLVPPGSTDAEGVLQLATTAEVLAGTDASKAISPAALAGAYTLSGTSASGYRKEPDGFITQWKAGTTDSTGTESSQTIYFPIAFPTACLDVQVSTVISGTSEHADVAYQIVSFDESSVTVERQVMSGNDEASTTPRILAKGH